MLVDFKRVGPRRALLTQQGSDIWSEAPTRSKKFLVSIIRRALVRGERIRERTKEKILNSLPIMTC